MSKNEITSVEIPDSIDLLDDLIGILSRRREVIQNKLGDLIQNDDDWITNPKYIELKAERRENRLMLKTLRLRMFIFKKVIKQQDALPSEDEC